MPLVYGDEEEQPQSTPLLPAMGKEALAATTGSVLAPLAEQASEIFQEDENGMLAREARTYRRVANAVRDLIPEDRRRQSEASFVPKEGQPSAWDAPFGTFAMKASSAAPIIVGMAATRNPALAAGLGALQGEAATLSDAKGMVENATDEELASRHPVFAEAIDMGLPSHEARKMLVSKLASPKTRAINAVGGAAGAAPFAHVARGVGRATLGGRLGVAAGEGAAGLGVQAGLADVAHQTGEVDTRARSEIDIADAVRSGLSGAIEGAAFGVGFGGAREVPRAFSRRPTAKVTQKTSQSEPSADQVEALRADETVTPAADEPTGMDRQVDEAQARIDAEEAPPPAVDVPVGETPPVRPDVVPGEMPPPEGTADLSTEYGAPTAGRPPRKARRQMRESDIEIPPVPDVIVPDEVIAPRQETTGPVEIDPARLPDQTRSLDQPVSVSDVPPVPDRIVDVPELPITPEAQPQVPAVVAPKLASELSVQSDLPTQQVARQTAAAVPSALPDQVRQARGLSTELGTTSRRKIGTLIAQKIADQMPRIAESRRANAEAMAKARAEGKPVVFRPDSTIDLKSVSEQAATEHRQREAQARVDRRARQMKETDNQARTVLDSEWQGVHTTDDRAGALRGDNEGVARYIARLDRMLKMAKQDRLPIFNESGNVMRESDATPTPHVSFLRDAAKLMQRVLPSIKEPARLPKLRDDVIDLAMQEEALQKGDYETAAAKRNARKALGVGDRKVSSKDVADMAVVQGAEADVADSVPTAKPMRRHPEPRPQDPDGVGPPQDGKNTAGLADVDKRSPEYWRRLNEGETYTLDDVLGRWQRDPDSPHVISDYRVKGVIDRLRKLAGDAKVVIVPDGTLGDDAVGLYHSPNRESFAKNHRGLIVIEQRGATFHSAIHEAVHAVTTWELTNNPYLRRRGEALFEYVKREYRGAKDEYGLENLDEFIAEAMSNPIFQAHLQRMAVPKHLADFNVRTAWDALVRLVARSLGLARNQHNALDAAMRMFDEASEAQVARRQGMAPEARPMRAPTREDVNRRLGSSNEWKLRVNRTLDKVATITQLANTSDRLFDATRPARRLAERMARMAVDRDRIVQGDDPLNRRLFDAQRRYGEKFRDFAEFMHDETTSGAFADRAVKDQKHIVKKDGSTRIDGWYAEAQHARLSQRWAELAKNPEFVALRRDLHKHYNDRQREMSLTLINNQLKAISEDGKGSPAMAKRIHEGKHTKADEAVLGDALPRILEAGRLAKIAGPYVPLMRRGDFVVQGRYVFDTPAGARRMDADETPNPAGNTLEFTTEEAAKRFVQNPDLDLHPTPHAVWVDRNTGSRYGKEADGTQVRVMKEDPTAEQRWRVELQDKHLEFFERLHDADLRRAELLADPRIKDVAQIDIRRQNAADLNLNFMPEQIRRLAETMRKRNSFKKLPAAAQNEMMRQLIDASIGAMGTTRAQSRRLPRTNVKGHSNDLAANSQQYTVSTAGYLAKLRHQPEADAILKQMQEYTDQTPHARGPAGAEDNMQAMRRQRLNEFENRLYSGGEWEPTSLIGKSITRFLQLSYLDKLASPAYHVINSMEPWTVSMPTIGGRHGLFRASRALQEAYNTIGGGHALVSGVKDTGRALRQDVGLTDYTKSIKDRAASAADGRELGALFDRMTETGLMSANAGLELSRLSDPSATKLGRALDRADHMARQLGTAVEAINRAVTATAAYRLERSKGASHEKAMEYAIETVHDTMGDYAGWNAPAVFNHPLGRVALQFKKYAQKTYYLLGKQAAAALKGDREAMKAFAGIMATHAAVAGTLGLPLEALRLGLLLSNVFGISGYTNENFEQDVRRGSAALFGQWGGQAFSRGLPRALGVDLSTRMGLDSLLLSPMDPKSMKKADLQGYLTQVIGGAPIDLATDIVQGFQRLGEGDVTEATRLLVPLKIYADSIQAYQLATEGKKSVGGRQQVEPIGAVEAFIKAAGFTPGAVAEQQEQTFAIQGQQKALRDERQKLIGEWVKGQPGSRDAQWQRILQWNKGKPAGVQIKYQDLISSMQRMQQEERTGTYQKGVRYTKRDQHLADQNAFYNTR